jgi:hypothetical protein
LPDFVAKNAFWLAASSFWLAAKLASKVSFMFPRIPKISPDWLAYAGTLAPPCMKAFRVADCSEERELGKIVVCDTDIFVDAYYGVKVRVRRLGILCKIFFRICSPKGYRLK